MSKPLPPQFLSGLGQAQEPLAAGRRQHSLLRRIAAAYSAWQERARVRHALLSLTDHQLRDIGLTRADVLRETNKPLWKA